MPKAVREVKSFNLGVVTAADDNDISIDAATYSQDIDPNSTQGRLQGRHEDAMIDTATYKTSLVNGVRVPSGEPTSGSIVINTSANVATTFKDGWSRASDFATNSDKPLVFMFSIGVVCLQKDGNNRRVFVNQLQSGDKNINQSNDADISGSPNINIGDGFREITFCINGDPFTGFVDFRGIKKV